MMAHPDGQLQWNIPLYGTKKTEMDGTQLRYGDFVYMVLNNRGANRRLGLKETLGAMGVGSCPSQWVMTYIPVQRASTVQKQLWPISAPSWWNLTIFVLRVHRLCTTVDFPQENLPSRLKVLRHWNWRSVSQVANEPFWNARLNW